ncbi:MAG TPA: PDZ domain-containing protein [Candidatus Obscuribacterales bacterium]
MTHRVFKLGNWMALLASVLLLSLVFPSFVMAQSDTAPALKALPMAPQIDPTADQGHKAQKPLQGTIQHNESAQAHPAAPRKALKSGATAGNGFFGKGLRGKMADTNPLNGRAADNGANPFNIQATSGFGIIGVKFVLAPGKPPIINRVFAGTPAAKVGMQANDAIVAVDGVPTFGLTKEEVYDLIIGSPGTTVSVSLMRGGDFRVVSCTRMDLNDIPDPIVRKDYLMAM